MKVVSNIIRLFSDKHVSQSEIKNVAKELKQVCNNVVKLEKAIVTNFSPMSGISRADAPKFLAKTNLKLGNVLNKAQNLKVTVNNEYHKKSDEKGKSLTSISADGAKLTARLNTCEGDINQAKQDSENYTLNNRKPTSSDAQNARADQNKRTVDQRKLDVKNNH